MPIFDTSLKQSILRVFKKVPGGGFYLFLTMSLNLHCTTLSIYRITQAKPCVKWKITTSP